MFSTVTLGDGRTVEYADLGDPAGRPVLFFHGTPATAGQAALVADGAREHHVRVVAVTRPGYGATTNTPPGLTSAAADALELADRLGVNADVVLGISGGGPFALALAALAPGRVSEVVVLGGPGSHAEVTPEILDEDDHAALELVAAGDLQAALARLTPPVERSLGPLQGLSADEFHTAFAGFSPPGPNWFDENPSARPLFEADFQRGITTFDGFIRDNLSWLSTWDFDLAAVTAPVRLVHGEEDVMVPPAHGDWLHARLPHSRRTVVPGGHGHATFGAAIDTFAALGSA